MRKRILVSAFTALAALHAAPVFAADLVASQATDCTCQTQAVQGAASIPVGSVISAQGSVQATKGASAELAKATVGTLLRDQSTVVTGADGSASILVGRDCRVDIPGSSQAVISRQEGQLCVRVATDGVLPADFASATPPAGPTAPLPSASAFHPMTVPLLIVAGSGVAYLLGDDGDGPSSR